jgi:carboxylesterase type B
LGGQHTTPGKTPEVQTSEYWICDNETLGIVCHASELTYVFHSIGWYPGFPRSAQEQQLSWDMIHAWTSFAAGKLSEKEWPSFQLKTKPSLLWELPRARVTHEYSNAACSFFDKIGYNW